MNMAFDGDGHVRTTLGLYYLGGLTDDEQVAVERHLASCESCLADYDDAGDLVLYLRTLTRTGEDMSSEDNAAPAPCQQREPLDTGDTGRSAAVTARSRPS